MFQMRVMGVQRSTQKNMIDVPVDILQDYCYVVPHKDTHKIQDFVTFCLDFMTDVDTL